MEKLSPAERKAKFERCLQEETSPTFTCLLCHETFSQVLKISHLKLCLQMWQEAFENVLIEKTEPQETYNKRKRVENDLQETEENFDMCKLCHFVRFCGKKTRSSKWPEQLLKHDLHIQIGQKYMKLCKISHFKGKKEQKDLKEIFDRWEKITTQEANLNQNCKQCSTLCNRIIRVFTKGNKSGGLFFCSKKCLIEWGSLTTDTTWKQIVQRLEDNVTCSDLVFTPQPTKSQE